MCKSSELLDFQNSPGSSHVSTDDLVYFARRAGEERSAALNSPDNHVRGVHLQFAEQYESRVLVLEQRAGVRTTQPLNCGTGPGPDPTVTQRVPARTHERSSTSQSLYGAGT